MRMTALAVLLIFALFGCVSQPTDRISLEEQQKIMQDVAASRKASATALFEYIEVCRQKFPAASNMRDDEGARFSIQGAVNIALNDQGYEIVCSVGVDSRTIERIWINQRTYTLQEYMFFERERKIKISLIEKDIAEITKGNAEYFIKAAKTEITESFKDPDSAIFRRMFLSAKSIPTLCGEVNAKNSYGGYVGYRKFFFNRILSIIDKPDSIEESSNYRKLASVYCEDKFAEVPK